MQKLQQDINRLILALARSVAAARLANTHGDDAGLAAALERARLNASEALGLQQLKMNDKKKPRPIDSP